MKSKSTTIVVNGVEWSENQRRRNIACEVCDSYTRGRIGKRPMCVDCAMREIMLPLTAVKDFLRGLFA